MFLVAAGGRGREGVRARGGGGGGSGGGYVFTKPTTVSRSTRNSSAGERITVLGRRKIQIDPIWNQVALEARKSAPKSSQVVFTLFRNDSHGHSKVKDIVHTTEEEISTRDKIFLSVHRILSDKDTLPGHFFWYMIDEFMKLCQERSILSMMLVETISDQLLSPRARRDDAHAVIRHVSACLLEFRPELGASHSMSEWTATVIESLVFGQIYDAVMEEISNEYPDNSRKSIVQNEDPIESFSIISEEAIEALHLLSKARTAVDKLHYCVSFMEEIPDGQDCAGEDLLHTVCQHLLEANVPNMPAEVAFIEEFARDNCLAHGREGYALVTLQAALQATSGLDLADPLENTIDTVSLDFDLAMEKLAA